MRKTLFFLLLLVPAILFADEVYLQGGAKFTGRIVEQTDKMVTIDIGDGIIGVPASRVERIVKAPSSLDKYDELAGKLREGDVQGWRNLGHWAQQEGLGAQSRQAYEKVVALDPDNAEARQALGYVQVEGRWMTEEESYRARGFVKHDGEWMTPAEAQMAQSTAAAAQSREDAEDRARAADVAAMEAAASEAKAQEEAKWEQSTQSWDFPVAYGGWGYGVTGWPSTAQVTWKQPAMRNPAPSVTVPR